MISIDTYEVEEQRRGRDKNTIINHTYIDSGAFRRKFDAISEDKEVNKLLYQLAKKMLKHRTGTAYEDMYWIDLDECKIVAEELNSSIERKIVYSDATNKVVEYYKKSDDKRLITIHSHPSSFPPSVDDLIANYQNEYSLGIVICHNGNVFMYEVNEEISVDYYNLLVADYYSDGYNEYEAQLLAIEELSQKFDIMFKEVTAI